MLVAIAAEMDLNMRKVVERWLEQQFGRVEDQLGLRLWWWWFGLLKLAQEKREK